MKKIFLGLATAALLSACSTDPEKLQSANDSYQKSNSPIPNFAPLASGGVNLPQQASTYDLPNIAIKKDTTVDIRPPSVPLAIIKNSLTQFDGERALIVYSNEQASLYNLQQIQRLLKEEGIDSTIDGAVLLTDWHSTERADDKSDMEIRYQVEQFTTHDASALGVSVAQMRRNNILFTPSVAEKQRYTSARLNRFVSTLTHNYNKQQQDLNNVSVDAFQSELITDTNGRTALGMNASFGQAWEKLGAVLPKLGFAIKSETAGRGQRELKYSPLDKEDWLRLGVDELELEKGTYMMQISAIGKQSAVVISDEDGNTINDEAAKTLYTALSVLLAK
ncbi:outer membrane assembly protein BamC [Rodentibacter caecimuris]|uniref:Outer membrane protein assembly factor BamC n=1 Tax=Rodentibacter caecimuris TaxID=1796644 RepID=A0A9X8VZ63_9PAST|nr:MULTISPECIES: outer membrane protein assembly factor BamC [Pasteurellaceae]AOF52655.1 Outer membrane protein NlpB [Pasteurellaceae bacterium NI1060]OOF71904.1 outer membrane assembly protein BamC [Rodentibacter heylii]OOF75222.1 outer membrane assembly protein BamC [Rodentibacter heylii]OOF76368.1 outer membrane assembly protein BamC [Rodentibacter heylii]TGY49919.1 outer membrane protein assembly factor BamC [Pasteurella caecimuris]